MHQIQKLMSSVQRSQTAMLEVVKLVNTEFARRTGHLEQITVPDDLLDDQKPPSELMQQFVVVKSEEEMVKLMWDNLKEGVPAFDVIISPFGCDHEALPQRIRKFIEEDDVVDDLFLQRRGVDEHAVEAAGLGDEGDDGAGPGGQ